MSRLADAIRTLLSPRSGRHAPEPRPSWEPGGGAGFVHYDVPGDFESEGVRAFGRLAARRPLPPGVEVRLLRRGEHDEWLDHLLEGAAGAELARRGADLASRIAAARSCLQVRGSVADPPDLDWLRDVEAVVDAALAASGLAVRDEVALRGFDPAAWRREVSGSGAPVARRHVTILVTPDVEGDAGRGSGDLLRTRGLGKVGRPDLLIRGVPEARRSEALAALNALTVASVAGERLPERGSLAVAGTPRGVEARGIESGALRLRLP